MNSRVREACNGKSASQGGLNVNELRNALIKLIPSREAEIRKAKRVELEKICKEVGTTAKVITKKKLLPKKMIKKVPRVKKVPKTKVVSKKVKPEIRRHKVNTGDHLAFKSIDNPNLADVTQMLGNQTKCLSGHTLKRILGSGGYGIVVESCLEDSCNYAVKIMKNNDNFRDEVEVASKMYKMGVGPKIYAIWECDDLATIVYDKWDMDLDNYLQKYPNNVISKKIIDKLQGHIDILHKSEEDPYVHLDLLAKNILVKVDKNNNVVDIIPTDFGLVGRLSDIKRKFRYNTWYDYFMQFPEGKNYFIDHFGKIPSEWRKTFDPATGQAYYIHNNNIDIQYNYPGDLDELKENTIAELKRNPLIFDYVVPYYLQVYKSLENRFL